VQLLEQIRLTSRRLGASQGRLISNMNFSASACRVSTKLPSWAVKLLRPHACFYPPRTEPAGSIVSIGGPRGAALIAAGIAAPAAQPPERDDSSRIAPADGFRTPEPEYEGAEFPVNFRLTDDPKDDRKLSAQADALVAALGRRRKYA
jgi:hypothetical protein